MTKVLTLDALGRRRSADVTTLGGAGVAMVDFGTGRDIASVSIAAPTILATSVAKAELAARATPDHSADEHVVEEVDVRAGAPTAGVGFTVYARTRNAKLRGRYAVAWSWS